MNSVARTQPVDRAPQTADYTSFPTALMTEIERAVMSRAGRRRGGEVTFTCPLPEHEDQHPSARWNSRKAAWICDVCKVGGGALDLADRLGIPKPADRPKTHKGSRRRVVATYDYRNAAGEVVYQVVRSVPKAFYQRRPDGRGGWINGLGGTEPVLYRLPDLLGSDDMVLVVEGEKDCDRLWNEGLLATTAPMGANRWRDSYTNTLAGREVAVLPDNDEAGHRHGQDLAARLTAAGCEVRVVDLPGLAEKGDVSNWLDLGFTRADLLDVIAEAPMWTPTSPTHANEEVSAALQDEVAAETNSFFVTARAFAERTPAVTDWVAAPWVARNAITELSGKIKSAGKTTWTLALCRAVLNGAPFLGRTATKGSIVYLTEQPQASFREALARAGLLDADDLHLLQWYQTGGLPWPDVVLAARGHARAVGAVLLVVDTLAQFAGLRGDAENAAGAALGAIAPLQQAAGDGLGVLVIRHDRKGGGEVGDSARGSSAFGGAVDVVLQLQRAEGNSRPTLRVLNALSRFSATPDTLMIELTDDGYRALGDKTAVALDEARRAIIGAAPSSEVDAVTERDLLDTTDTKRTVGQEALRRLVADGVIVRVGAGKRGDPYRYSKPSGKVSAATSSLSAAERNDRSAPAAGKVSAATPVVTAESNGHAVVLCAGCGLPVPTDARPCRDAVPRSARR